MYGEVAIHTPLPQRSAQRTHGKQSLGESQWRGSTVATLRELHAVSIAQPAQAGYNGPYAEGEQVGIGVSRTTRQCDSTVQSFLDLHPFTKHPWVGRVWVSLVYRVVRLFFRLRCRVRIEGSDYIPTQGGVVLVSNHISAFDTILIPYSVIATQGLQIVWAPAKAELFNIRLLGSVLTSFGAFPVRRGQHDRRAMRRMIVHMRTDKVMLFPEGTRSLDGQLQAGKRTVGKLIYAARPMVIPVAVLGTERILPQVWRLWQGRIPVTIRYGHPLALQHYYTLPDTKETAIAIVQEVMGAIASLVYNASQLVVPSLVAHRHPHSGGKGRR